jgi:hypothetical protein
MTTNAFAASKPDRIGDPGWDAAEAHRARAEGGTNDSEALAHAGDGRCDAALDTAGRDALEHAHHGEGAGGEPVAVIRIWHAHGLKPHLTRTFKLSNDKHFVQKVEDVVGLYMNPPDNALVLSVDEKSQIQALDRTQPELPLKKGRCGTMTHDYKRNGTTTLFTALDVSRGSVITDCMPRHPTRRFAVASSPGSTN